MLSLKLKKVVLAHGHDRRFISGHYHDSDEFHPIHYIGVDYNKDQRVTLEFKSEIRNSITRGYRWLSRYIRL